MSFVMLVLVLSWVSATPLITKEFIEELKTSVTWDVTNYEENGFRGFTFEDAKLMLLDDEEPPHHPNSKFDPQSTSDTYPESFDARDAWPNCIHRVRNQGRCGASWAIGPTSATSDRFCIHGKDVMLAPQDLVSCDKNNDGCSGGYLDRAMNRMVSAGAVEEDCFPFVSGNLGDVPNCPNQCPNPGKPFVRHRCGYLRALHNMDTVKYEISKQGPVPSRFDVYADFYSYKSGVYYHQSGGQVGGLAVKVIGWGKEDDKEYWLCQNSWGPSWGIGGFFKIRQGDCRINEFFRACDPLLV
jgi:cathepsin B